METPASLIEKLKYLPNHMLNLYGGILKIKEPEEPRGIFSRFSPPVDDFLLSFDLSALSDDPRRVNVETNVREYLIRIGYRPSRFFDSTGANYYTHQKAQGIRMAASVSNRSLHTIIRLVPQASGSD